MAATVARQGSGCTAAKAPVSALAEHPTPVTRVIQEWPLDSTAWRPRASTTWSRTPEMHTTPRMREARRQAAGTAWSEPARLSTPRVPGASPATLMISEALPRSTSGNPSSRSSASARSR